MAITRAQQVRQMLKKGSEPVVQGGVENYLGRQPEVQAPRKWQSGPDKPPTELAYITEAEKKLLLKEDIHGSLKDGPNEGPAGIMSLDSFGDIGGAGQAGSEVDSGRDEDRAEKTTFSGKGQTETDQQFEDRKAKQRTDLQTIEREEAKKAKEFTTQAKKQRSFFNKLKQAGLPTQKILYNVFPNNPNNELAFLSGLTKQQVTALGNKELSELYDAIQEADFSGDLSFEDALGDKYQKLSFDAFKALSKRGIESGFIDPQGEFGNMDFAEYVARIKGAPGLLYSGNVGGLIKIKNPDGTFRYERRSDDDGPSGESDLERRLRLLEEQNQQAAAPAVDPTMFRFMNRGGMVEDAPMGTGIMDLESARQMMFIGGVAKAIGKGLKSVTRAAKKVVKSPFGKAAILGAIGFGIPGTSFTGILGGKGTSFSLGDILKKSLLKDSTGAFSLENLSGGKIAALSGLAGLVASKQTEEDNFDIDKYYEEEGLKNFIASLQPRYRLGTFNAAKGGKAEPVAKKTMPLLDLDGKEMDFRAEGGFVPIGRMEKADDVPARLSKNEFVFTADAVRNAGDGDVDKGAEVMYNTMKNLEAGGKVSEETQGLDGAKEMFQTAQRLEGVM